MLWQHVPVRYRARETWFLSLSSLTRRDNEIRGVHVPGLSQGWLESVCFSNNYIFCICYFGQVRHIYVSLQDCASSSVLTCPNTICISVCWWRTFQPCVGPFREDRFLLYCRGPSQNKHTQVMVFYRLIGLFFKGGWMHAKVSTEKTKCFISLRADVIDMAFSF